ncbi:sulfite exporter TauE/SafE family protein 3-like, partial [Carica papaya]|uniref:sulfite exporter TauE/SafE family protein 3-like n=1 Tax=Carica papaya TaxID=3649 RepID=UPI000B8C74E4
MATTGSCTFSCKGVILLISFIVLASLVLYPKHQQGNIQSANYLRKAFNFLENKDDDHHQSHYEHHWPELRFGWRIVVGTVIGFMGAAFGSVGGVGGGGIFVPMLSLIIGFDTKSSAAMSKCMITGASLSTVYYNLGQKHPSLDLPVIDYDLALLFQPMLILGISIGVDLNVILADWMITVLLIILFFVIATKAFWRGVRTWKKETIVIHEEARRVEPNGDFMDEAECEVEGEDTSDKKRKVSIVENVYWKEVGLLVGVWVIILALQIAKNHTSTCSWAYWVFNVLQIPVAVGVSSYEAVSVYKGKRKMASRGEARAEWKAWKLVFFCLCGVVGGIVGGLLGLGGGFILGPLFLDMGF